MNGGGDGGGLRMLRDGAFRCLTRKDLRPSRFNPFAVIGEAAACTDGVDDVIAGDDCRAGLFDDLIERMADKAIAAGEEPHGMGVAVNGRVVGDSKLAGERFGALPVEEGVLNLFAVGVVADDATAPVPFEAGLGLLSFVHTER